MVSKNHLSMTGVVNGLLASPERSSIKFTLVHNYGGGKPPLFLPCIVPKGARVPIQNGETLCVDAYLQCVGGQIKAVVKRIS